MPLRSRAPRARYRTSARLAPTLLRLLGLTALLLATAPGARAQESILPAATPDLIETGTPPFVLLRPESMGLSAPPTDLHELPNGAILAVNENELAIGDGVRWETFRRSRDTAQTALANVAVDQDGLIYAGVSGGIARIDLDEDGQWHFTRTVSFPVDSAAATSVLSRIVVSGEEWYWHNGSGPLVAWRPGRPFRLLGVLNDIECVFNTGGATFVSDAASGALLRIQDGKLSPGTPGGAGTLDHAITGALALPDGTALLGDNTQGLIRFDGRSSRPLTTASLLAGRHRVNDLCRVGDGLFAAALDTFGIAFFNHEGRVLQVIDRTASNHLARVRRLVGGSGGSSGRCWPTAWPASNSPPASPTCRATSPPGSPTHGPIATRAASGSWPMAVSNTESTTTTAA